MQFLRAVMAPHPPLILPQIGKGERERLRSTEKAYTEAARFIAEFNPDTIVVLTPHNVMYGIWFHISPGTEASGNYMRFGAGNLRLAVRYDSEFVDSLCALARKDGFPAGTEGEGDAMLDHATMIPLSFVQKAYGEEPLPPIVRVGLSCLPVSMHYKLGMLIRRTADKLGRRIAVIASGDLSHRLREDSPYGFRMEGAQYDARIMDVMGRAAFGELFSFSDSFCEAAGECGHRSFSIMAGCFDGEAVSAKALSYEAPFGVGYGICTFESKSEKDASRCFLDAWEQDGGKRSDETRGSEDAYVRLARSSLENFVLSAERTDAPDNLPREMLSRRAGVFVTLRKDGRLRGCAGTISPSTGCISEEIIRNSIKAGSQDSRFSPVDRHELPNLSYCIDVLGKAEDISSSDQLDIRRYGIIVSNGFRRGLLLPDTGEIHTVEDQIALAKRKAGIGPTEKVFLQRFEVERHF